MEDEIGWATGLPVSLLGAGRREAEMNLPGRAWLEFEVTCAATGSIIRQTAIFDPLGLSGPLYWYLLYPFHKLVFAGMLRGVCSTAARKVNDRAA
jgi:hypothetical protein